MAEAARPAGAQGFAFIQGCVDTSGANDEKLVGVCLKALEGYEKRENERDLTSIELLGCLIAEGAKDPGQKATAERIARALSKTELYKNASHTVRGNIESALRGGEWFFAKERRCCVNHSKYCLLSSSKG